jgi:hypothetical protein
MASSIIFVSLACTGVLFITIGAKSTWRQRKRLADADSLWITMLALGAVMLIYLIAARHLL